MSSVQILISDKLSYFNRLISHEFISDHKWAIFLYFDMHSNSLRLIIILLKNKSFEKCS